MSEIVLTVDDFRAAFPKFTAVKYTDNVIQGFITQSYCYVSSTNCGSLRGDCRKLAIELMVAHLLTLNDRIASGTSQSGQLASSTIGDVSISLLAPPNKTQWDYWINQTPYGQRLYALLMSKAPAGMYLGGSCQRVLR